MLVPTRLLLGLSALLALHGATARAEVHRAKFTTPSAYLVVEVLDDDLVHFELSALGAGPPLDRPLYTSPMVLRTDYGGPSMLSAQGNVIETAGMRLEVDPAKAFLMSCYALVRHVLLCARTSTGV